MRLIDSSGSVFDRCPKCGAEAKEEEFEEVTYNLKGKPWMTSLQHKCSHKDCGHITVLGNATRADYNKLLR